jgi:hypothetical protein
VWSEIDAFICEVNDPHGGIPRMRRPGIIAYADTTPVAYAEIHPGADRYILRLPRRLLQGRSLRIEVVHNLVEPQGVLMGGNDISTRAARIWMPKFKGAPRPRNILLANYGNAVPEGAHVRDAHEISEVYARLHAHELTNEGARIEFV